MLRNYLPILLVFTLVFNGYSLKANDIDAQVPKDAEKLKPAELLELAEENTHRNFDLAIAYTELAEKKARKKADNQLIFEAFKQRGRIYEFNNRLAESLLIYKQAETIANKANNDTQRLSIYTDIAIVERRLSNYSESQKYHKEALAIAEKINDIQGIENSYYGLATLHKNMASYDKALEYYNKVVQSTKKSGDTYRMLNTRQYLAVTYSEAGQYDLAIKEIKGTFNGATKLGDSLLIGAVAFDYATILAGQNEKKAALEKYLYSLAIFEALSHKPLISRSLFYIGDMYAELNNLDEARKYFATCQSYKQYMSIKSLSDLQYRMGHLYLKLGQNDLAKKALLESLEIAEQNNLKELCQKSHHELSNVYKNENNLTDAFFHLSKSEQFKDSLLTESKQKTIREINFREDVRESDEQIADLQTERKNLLTLGSLGVSALVVAFLMILLYNNRRSTKQLKQKNSEIHNQNIKLRESNGVLHQFTYVTAHDLKEPVRNIGSFISLLKRRYGKDFNPEATEYMTFIMNGSKRINSLLTDLERYTSISLQEPKRANINTSKAVVNGIQQLEVDLAKVDIEMNDDLPNVRMSPKHLAILFKEIFENAIRFNANEHPKILVSATKNQGVVNLKIADNGVGILKEHKAKLFNLFYQGEKNWENEGTGIGLTICKNIIDKYDGTISFEDNPNGGTIVNLTLPSA